MKVLIALLLVLILPAVASSAPAYHYENLIGHHHAAYWHGYRDVPEVVNYWFPGIATGDWSIPFGTCLKITVIDVPEWAEEEYSHLIGNEAYGIVLDRMPRGHYGAIDCWPKLFELLAGPEWRRVGRLEVAYEECE